MRRRLALTLHGWAYRLAPELGLAVRQAIIEQLAADWDTKKQAEQHAAGQRLAAHREFAARSAQNN